MWWAVVFFCPNKGVQLAPQGLLCIQFSNHFDIAEIHSCFFNSKIEDLENEIEDVKTNFEMKNLALSR